MTYKNELSIIIVSWNTKEVTRNCLVSVFENLGDLRCEVIVVDNASSDGSAEMVRSEFPKAILIESESNVGFPAGNNLGFEIASGEFVLLLNSDTIVLGDVLQKSVDYMRAHKDVGAFGCRVLNEDRTVQLTCFSYSSVLNSLIKAFGLHTLPWPPFFGREKMRDWARDTERDVDVVTGCYLMVPQKALNEVGGMDDGFFFCYDEPDWCKRFQKAGWKVRFSPVGEIVHLGNVSGKKIGYKRDLHLVRGKIRFHHKHFGTPNAVAIWMVTYLFFLNRIIVLSPLVFIRSHRERFISVFNVLKRYPGLGFALDASNRKLTS